ncbi:MAG TPA: hypothetical protein VGL55_09590 [Steroidobacteraceae bacterium]|jgi:hypothetical protein
MKSVQNVLGVVHAALWIAALVAVDLIFSDTPSRAGYGLLCSWWVTLYVALLLRTTWRALPAFLGLMVVALVVDAARGTGFLYHDAPPISSPSFLVLAAGLLVLWASPIVVNEIATRVRDRLGTARDTR